MSEQLWYTWSTSGFGIANDYRVRAASPKLTDVTGPRLRSLLTLVSYTLPQHTDPFLPPEKAPLCLAFLKSGPEAVLIQKTYTGLDGLKRPGVYFSHLLVDLPPVPSPCMEGYVSFSAREAISLWKATTQFGEPFWRNTERGWPEGSRDLSAVADSDLLVDLYLDQYTSKYVGPLNTQAPGAIAQQPELFKLVLQAFLTLAQAEQRKRLYLIGDPDTVAALIWGITHALPRTLDIMRDLTFSTFESNLEADTTPLIVGTCWLPKEYRQKGYENTQLDIPQDYYRPDNPYGIAIRCEPPYTYTPFQPDEPVQKYSSFVLESYQMGKSGVQNLKTMLDEAEKNNFSRLPDVLTGSIAYQLNLSPEDIRRILTALNERMVRLINHATAALNQEKLSAAVAEVQSLLRLKLAAQDVQRPGFLSSIKHLMSQNPDWWEREGKEAICYLYKLSGWYGREQLQQAATAFQQKIIDNREWRRKQGSDLINAVLPLVPAQGTPEEMLAAFVQLIGQRVLEAQKELRESLLPLACQFTDQLVQSLRGINTQDAVFWSNIFADMVDSQRQSREIRAYLLEQLANLNYSPVYQQWWQQYGQQNLALWRVRLAASPSGRLSSAFSTLASAAVPRLSAALQANNWTEVMFWTDVLQTVAPVAEEPAVWASLFVNLRDALFTAAFQQWWRTQGQQAAAQLSKQAASNGTLTAQLAQVRQSVVEALAAILQAEVQRNQPEDEKVTLLFEVLNAVTPVRESQSALLLLQTLSNAGLAQRLNWQRRGLLLRYWGQAARGEVSALLRPWLEVSWYDLPSLLALGLPEAWNSHALAHSLSFYQQVSARQVIEVVNQVPSLLENVLADWFTQPQRQPFVMQFFGLLATNQYLQLLPLLARLAAASRYHSGLTEQLLQMTRFNTDREIAILLEQYCQQWIASYDLPPTMLPLIEHYLNHFDVESLDTAPTRTLLQALLQRGKGATSPLPASLQETAQGWYKIAEFLAEPKVSYNALRELSHSLRNMSRLVPDVQKKLSVKLVPHLVEMVETDADLVRVIDNLGRAASLQMLQNMAKRAGEKYGQERPPVRLAPYVRTILAEARSFDPSQKEQFLAACFQFLFVHVDKRTRDKFKSDALWSQAQLKEWEQAQRYLRSTPDISESLNRFREAIQKLYIPGIAASYDSSFASYLTADEQWLLEQAWAFVAAYQVGNDTEMLLIADTIKQRYPQTLYYTQDQLDRMQRARQRREQQQAPSAPAPQPALQHYSSPAQTAASTFSGNNQMAGSQQMAAQQQSAGYRQMAANQQGAGSYPVAGNEQSPAIWQQGSSMPPLTSNPPSPFIAQQSPTQAAQPPGQRSVAIVKGQQITANMLDWTAKLIAPYLKWRKTQLNAQIQTGDKRRQDSVKQEVKEIEQWLAGDPQQLRRCALDYLIDDALIELTIKQMGPGQWEGFSQEVESRLGTFYREIMIGYVDASSSLRSPEVETNQSVQDILAIFLWRQRFESYLATGEQSLTDWLKKEKQREKNNITIDYEQAGIKPDRRRLFGL